MQLDGLLVLLHDSDSGFQSLHAEFDDYVRPPRSNTIVLAQGADGTKRVSWAGAGLFPQAAEGRRRIWFEQPNRTRVEIYRGDQLVRAAVREGSRWSRWDLQEGRDHGLTVTSAGGAALPAMLRPPLLFPSELLAHLRFRPTGTDKRLERDVITARGFPRIVASDRSGLQYEFAFDAAHGTVLSRQTFANGSCVRVTRARSVSFDVGIEADRFSLDALPFVP